MSVQIGITGHFLEPQRDLWRVAAESFSTPNNFAVSPVKVRHQQLRCLNGGFGRQLPPASAAMRDLRSFAGRYWNTHKPEKICRGWLGRFRRGLGFGMGRRRRFRRRLLTVFPLRGTGQRSNLFESHGLNLSLTFVTSNDYGAMPPAIECIRCGDPSNHQSPIASHLSPDL